MGRTGAINRIRTGIVVLTAALVVTVLPFAVPAQADAPGDFVAWSNIVRGGAGSPAIAADSRLTVVAQQWAAHMAATGVVAQNPDLAAQSPQGWAKIGENIGSGYSLAAVFNAFDAKPDIYANLVDPAYNRVGVGVAVDAKGQVWVAQDLGAYPPPAPAEMVFPTSGTLIFPMAQLFSWSAAQAGVYYCVTVGTTLGGVDVLNSGLLAGTQLSYPIPALPGGHLWARVYTYIAVPSQWLWSDVSFTVSGAAIATLTRPTDGAANIDTTQPFTWSPIAAAGYYGLTVGTTRGGYNLVNSGPLKGTVTSYLVAGLTAGTVLWARLYSFIAGSWNHYQDVSFTAAPRSTGRP